MKTTHITVIAILAIAILAGAYLWRQQNQHGTGLHNQGTLSMRGVPALTTGSIPTLAVQTITETGTGRILYIVYAASASGYPNFVGDVNSLTPGSRLTFANGDLVWFNGMEQRCIDTFGNYYLVIQLTYLTHPLPQFD